MQSQRLVGIAKVRDITGWTDPKIYRMAQSIEGFAYRDGAGRLRFDPEVARDAASFKPVVNPSDDVRAA